MLFQETTPKSVVVLASSFYTACLERPFADALTNRGDGRSLLCVPYNQLQTFLLDPRSSIPDETRAHVILFLRVEDLVRLELAERANKTSADQEFCLRVFRERTAQFLEVLSRLSRLRLTLLVCPSARGAYDTRFLGNAVRVAEHRSAAELLAQQRHRIFFWSDFGHAAPTANLFNAAGDRLGHVPFSPDGLDALAEFFVSRLDSLPATILETQAPGHECPDLQKFLASLNLEITIAPLTHDDEEDALQLIRHTTHFINLPDRKWSAGDIGSLIRDSDGEAWVLRVRDRFGDYGISGALAFTWADGIMRVPFLFLTCPILGKQVEHALILWMAEVAHSRQATLLDAPFVKGRDNQVLYTFLAQMAGDAPADALAVLPSRAQRTFHLPVAQLKECALQNAVNPSAVTAIQSGPQSAAEHKASA